MLNWNQILSSTTRCLISGLSLPREATLSQLGKLAISQEFSTSTWIARDPLKARTARLRFAKPFQQVQTDTSTTEIVIYCFIESTRNSLSWFCSAVNNNSNRRWDMARRYTEYVYKNTDDTIRIKIFKRCYEDYFTIEWDADVFFKNDRNKVTTYSHEAGDYFYSKRQAKAYYLNLFGKLTSIQPIDTITNGWD